MNVGTTAFAVAVIGAAATFVIGLLNYHRQGQTLRLQRDYQSRQIDLLQSTQTTDRFTRAIEQMGSGSLQVRMGGIYAMERIARDLPGERQYVADTLAAFVRACLPAADVGDGGYVPILRLRAPDAQAALTILCRPSLWDPAVTPSAVEPIDLSRTDLRRANLRDARLEGASLWGARLEGVDLRGAHLANSVLENANFGRIDAGNNHFRHGADLSDADLSGARLGGAFNLEYAVTEGTRGLSG
jgi:hypothetical protein